VLGILAVVLQVAPTELLSLSSVREGFAAPLGSCASLPTFFGINETKDGFIGRAGLPKLERLGSLRRVDFAMSIAEPTVAASQELVDRATAPGLICSDRYVVRCN
jgi:hypothetical protein